MMQKRRKILPLFVGAIALLAASRGESAQTPLVCNQDDIVGISARRKAVKETEALKARGIDKMPLSTKSLTDADHKLDELVFKSVRGTDDQKNVPEEILRFKGFQNEAGLKKASAAAPPLYTNGVYRGKNANANIGFYSGTFDPPQVGHRKVIEESLKQGNLDEVYVFVNRNPEHKPGASGFATREEMAELEFSGNPKIKLIDPAAYPGKTDSEIVHEIIAMNGNHIVTKISGEDVLLHKPAGEMDPGNVRYIVAGRSEDKEMVEAAIKARFGERLEKNPQLVRRIEGTDDSSTKVRAAIERGEPPTAISGLSERVANYIEQKRLFQPGSVQTHVAENAGRILPAADSPVSQMIRSGAPFQEFAPEKRLAVSGQLEAVRSRSLGDGKGRVLNLAVRDHKFEVASVERSENVFIAQRTEITERRRSLYDMFGFAEGYHPDQGRYLAYTPDSQAWSTYVHEWNALVKEDPQLRMYVDYTNAGGTSQWRMERDWANTAEGRELSNSLMAMGSPDKMFSDENIFLGQGTYDPSILKSMKRSETGQVMESRSLYLHDVQQGMNAMFLSKDVHEATASRAKAI
ncbi:MAG: nicotinate-nicotinamide nucleotide adenylyltransferase, partial [Bdellovibrionota bacterium]